MDDFTIVDERLTTALDNLRYVNRWLGGYAATMKALAPLLHAWAPGRRLRVLDLASGAADFPAYLVGWAARRGREVEVVGLDANPVTVAYARHALDRDVPASLRPRIRVDVGDALATPYDAEAFDVCVVTHFLHHLAHDEAVALLGEMRRVARHGFIVNDLHRHPLAYYGILALATALPVSPMFRHDGPISVLRGFTRAELRALAEDCGLERYDVRWHWAFRWTLTALDC